MSGYRERKSSPGCIAPPFCGLLPYNTACPILFYSLLIKWLINQQLFITTNRVVLPFWGLRHELCMPSINERSCHSDKIPQTAKHLHVQSPFQPGKIFMGIVLWGKWHNDSFISATSFKTWGQIYCLEWDIRFLIIPICAWKPLKHTPLCIPMWNCMSRSPQKTFYIQRMRWICMLFEFMEK